MTATLPSTTLDDLAAYISGTGQRNRKAQLPYSSIDNARLTLKTGGVVSGYVGTQWDGTTGLSVVNGPIPPRPAAPTAWTTLGGFTVRWNGTYDPAVITGPNGADTPAHAPDDFRGVEIQVSDEPSFAGGDAFDKVRGPLMTSARGGDMFIPWPEGDATVYVRLVVRTTAGKVSAPSPAVEVTTGAVQAQVADRVEPGQVLGLDAMSYTETDATGREQGRIAAWWTEPLQNADGTSMTDLSHFEVNWKWIERTGNLWETTTARDPGAILPAITGLTYDARVRAVDRSDNLGAWSALKRITVGKDTTPPLAPEQPTVTNYMGQLRIVWSGRMVDLTDPPADFSRVEVHVGTTANFTAVQGTRVAALATGGEAYAVAPYAQTRYVRLYAFDVSGNRSESSVVVAGSTSKVVSDDILAGAVGNLQLANLAVRSANIDLLAVNTQHVAELHVGRLVGGVMTANVIMGGRLATSDGIARTEMNTLGFQKFRADGSKAVSITDFETLLTGQYKTAESGRRIEMGTVGAAGEINFYAPDGQRSFIKSYTEPDVRAIESIQIGMDRGGHYLWNRININDREEIRADGHMVNLHFLNDMNAFGEAGKFTVSSYTGRAGWGTDFVNRILIEGDQTIMRDRANITRFAFGPDWLLVRNPTNTHRLNLAWNATYIHRADGRISWEELPGNVMRFHTSGTGSNEGWIEFLNNAGAPLQSPRILFVQGNFAATTLKAWDNALEVRNAADSAWHSIRAFDHPAMSDARLKTDIRDAQLDGTAAVKAMRVRSYKAKRPKPGTVDETEEVEQLGLIAQEVRDAGIPIVAAPASDGTLGVSLYEYVTVLAKSLQEALARIDALEARPGKGNA